MPTREAVVRIAKMLAGATSSEPAEATAKLHGAYKRMVRDGVTLSDLLSLPIGELYQDTLIRLVDLILDEQKDLSATGRREAYSQYLVMIVARFSGNGEGRADQDTSRADEAREYEARRRAEEARREQASRQVNEEKPFKSNNSNTPKQENSPTPTASDRVYRFRIWGKPLEFSIDGFVSSIQVVFGRGSILWHTAHDPMRGVRLFGASLLFGMAVAAVVLVLAGVVHSLTNTQPLWDIQVKNAFAFLTACGFVWKAWRLHVGGWFR